MGMLWYGLPETPPPPSSICEWENVGKKIKNKHTCIYQKYKKQNNTTKNILRKRLIKENPVCARFNILIHFQ